MGTSQIPNQQLAQSLGAPMRAWAQPLLPPPQHSAPVCAGGAVQRAGTNSDPRTERPVVMWLLSSPGLELKPYRCCSRIGYYRCLFLSPHFFFNLASANLKFYSSCTQLELPRVVTTSEFSDTTWKYISQPYPAVCQVWIVDVVACNVSGSM